MSLESQLDLARQSLDSAARSVMPNTTDLDRRRRRHLAVISTTAIIGLGAVGVAGVVLASGLDNSDDMISTGAASTGTAPARDVANTISVPAEPSKEPAYGLSSAVTGWNLVDVETITPDLGVAFAGEDFTQLAVAFDVEPDPFGRREGTITRTIRIGVGTYTDDLRKVYRGPGTPVSVGSRDFEIVEVDEPTFKQIALIPVDLSERTFVITARGVEPETLTTLAESIDPTTNSPRVGSSPVGFTVIHAGAPEFATLDRGTSLSYRDPSNGGRTLTITTFSGPPISCFAYGWVHPDTEITPIGGDQGVVAQVDGEPGLTGTYEALWNVNGHTLVGVSATGITRLELVEIADQLALDREPTGGHRRSLPFAL
jgi:hypothetical protein